jgi:hypothetical protein
MTWGLVISFIIVIAFLIELKQRCIRVERTLDRIHKKLDRLSGDKSDNSPNVKEGS